MKLTTKQGELTLPEGFSVTINRNNPFLTEEGDASYPVGLPLSSDNKKTLQYPHRVENASRPLRKQPAILSNGILQLRGTLIMSEIDENTASVALAIDNGDLWANFKDKKLKDIVGSGTIFTANSMTEMMNHVHSVNADLTTADYAFPVIAVSKYVNDKNITFFQINNEPDQTDTNTPRHLVYETRTQIENGNSVWVPEGYGIAPQLYFHKALEHVFAAIGYTVTENFFAASPWNQLLLLNNNSDEACTLRFKLADMLPSCTLSELCEMLHDKFHIQVLADSNSKTVKIVRMEDLIDDENDADIDISDMLCGDWKHSFNESSRVVLSSDLSIDGAAGEKETVAELMEKYDHCQPVSEREFLTLETYYNPEDTGHDFYDCLVLRLATGDYYRLSHDMNTGLQKPERTGTNAMTYDRNNSDASEVFASADMIAPTVKLYDGVFAPYIGERIHYNTHMSTSTDTDKDMQQPIIFAWHCGLMSVNSVNKFFRMANTQHYDNNGNSLGSIDTDLVPLGLYDGFWSSYNEILLNNKVEVEGRVEYPLHELMRIDMTKMKLYKGQKLLPENMEFAVGGKTVNMSSRFIVRKRYSDMIEDDSNIFPTPANRYRWKFDKREIDELIERYTFHHDLGGGVEEDQSATSTFTDLGSGMLWLGQPSAANLITHEMTRPVNIHVHYIKENLSTGQILEEHESNYPFVVTVRFVSEAI